MYSRYYTYVISSNFEYNCPYFNLSGDLWTLRLMVVHVLESVTGSGANNTQRLFYVAK